MKAWHTDGIGSSRYPLLADYLMGLQDALGAVLGLRGTSSGAPNRESNSRG